MFLEIVKYTIIKPFIKPAIKGAYKAKTLLETKKEEKQKEKKENHLKDLLIGISLLLFCILGGILTNEEYRTKIIEYFKNLFF